MAELNYLIGKEISRVHIFYGVDLMRVKIALALMSLVYISYIGVILGGILANNFEHSFGYNFDGSFAVIILLSLTLLPIISFLGSILFIFETRKVLPKWYLAIPLSISLLLQPILSYAVFFGIRSIPSVMSIEIPQVLISVSSILVFLSLHKHPVSTKWYMIILSTMSIISIVGLLNQNPINRYNYTLMSYYWVFGMPIIGLCFLVKAITCRNPGNVSSPATAVSSKNSDKIT